MMIFIKCISSLMVVEAIIPSVIQAQSAGVIKLGEIWPDNNGLHINASDGRYIWLPIEFKDGVPVQSWKDAWSPENLN